MAYAKKTLLDLQQSLADRHDSGILPTASATLTFWTRLLNKGVAYCADKLRLSKEVSLTTVNGTVALPTDFLIINGVYVDNNPYTMVAPDDLGSQNGFAYWITGNHFDGFYLNTVADQTYTVEYAYKPAEMVSNADICIISDPEAVVAYAYAMLRKSETDPIGDAAQALQECDSRLSEMQDALSINTNFQGFVIQ